MNKNYEFVGDSDSDDDSDYTSKTNSVNSGTKHSIEEKTPKYKVFTYDYLLSTIVDYSNTKKVIDSRVD